MAESFTPKWLTVWREGYGWGDFRADALAGLTVAIVALPLSMAIAVASGVTPDRGLYAAIIGGFLVSALGGSRFQIGGPAGAFIILVASTVAVHGVDGLILATLLSGLFLTILGVTRAGSLIRFIPHPVTVGFTTAIAATILASQLKDLMGLVLTVPEPGPLLPKLQVLWEAGDTFSLSALVLGLCVAGLVAVMRAWRPLWPNMLLALGLAALASQVLHLPVETIGERFGDMPRGLPMPRLPEITLQAVLAILPTALAFTLLGGIESLLSAVVADGMTGRQHRSSLELVAQGVANVGSALFGGMPVTGTIARTATNVRAGARGPAAGMLHSVFLLVFLWVAAPLAGYIPLPGLAGVLLLVAANMVERSEIARYLRHLPSGVILIATFGLTLARDLVTGIIAGCALALIFHLFRRIDPDQGQVSH